MTTIETLATEYAASAIEAGGPNPYDSDGRCLLPEEPMPGDWAALRDELGREPTEDERRRFRDAYCARLAG